MRTFALLPLLLALAATDPLAPALAEPVAVALVTIESPRGGQTRDRVVTITGTVEGLAPPRVTLVLNGVPLSIPLSAGRFESRQVLAPGANAVRVVAEEDGRRASDEVHVHALVPAKDLRITLTWDTAGTDVDLWVTGPDGEKVFYQHAEGAAGGTLDVDVTSGFGPETYTQARALPGTYRVEAHYFGDGPPTRAMLTVTRGEGSPSEERKTFRALLLRQGDVARIGEFTVAR
jgi:uncharacterized protein YfaP (DUF2135 family)